MSSFLFPSSQKIKNEIDSSIKNTLSNSVTTALKLSVVNASTNSVVIKNCDNIDLGDITQESGGVVDLQAYQKNLVDQMNEQKTDVSASQMADQLAQAFSLSANNQDMEQINRTCIDVMNSIVDATSTDCITDQAANNSVEVECTGAEGSMAHIRHITQNAALDAHMSCMQNNSAVTKATSDLQATMEQVASQKVDSIFSGLAGLLMVIAGIFLAPMFMGSSVIKSAMKHKAMQVILVGMIYFPIMGYLYLECDRHKFPLFTIPIVDVSVPPAWCKESKDMWISMGGLTVAAAFVVFVILKFGNEGSSKGDGESEGSTKDD